MHASCVLLTLDIYPDLTWKVGLNSTYLFDNASDARDGAYAGALKLGYL